MLVLAVVGAGQVGGPDSAYLDAGRGGRNGGLGHRIVAPTAGNAYYQLSPRRNLVLGG